MARSDLNPRPPGSHSRVVTTRTKTIPNISLYLWQFFILKLDMITIIRSDQQTIKFSKNIQIF